MSQGTERYVTAFEAFSANGAGTAPEWLVERRQRAIEHFAQRGFPSAREEAWRFTDVKALTRADFALAASPPDDLVSREAIATALIGDGQRFVAVFVNGHFRPGLSSLAGLPAGILVGGVTDALARDGERMQQHLAMHAGGDANPFTALSTAFAQDGAYVHVPPDVVLDRPIQLVFVGKPDGEQPLVWHPRNLVVVDRGARVSVVETYLGLGAGSYWTNAVTEVVVGDNANVDTYRIQRETDEAFHTATTQSYQGRNSVYSCVTFTFGGILTRHDLNAVLDGEGGEATLDGLTMVRGRQHVDYHTILEHAKPHCNSWEFFNGIFGERSRGVFSGRIIVRPGAQKTDSKQTNNNLLLSQTARADSQPQLEIYADDVKCTHGATLGPLDLDHVFYLQARGLDADQARALLTYGFAAEILSNVTLEPLRWELELLVHRWLAEATAG